MIKFLTSGFLLIAILLTGCTAGKKSAADNKLEFTGGKWVIEEIQEKKVDPLKAGNQIPYMDFDMDKKTVSVFAGCNRLNCGFAVSNDTITFQTMIATRMACPDMDYENMLEKLLAPGMYAYRESVNSLFI